MRRRGRDRSRPRVRRSAAPKANLAIRHRHDKQSSCNEGDSDARGRVHLLFALLPRRLRSFVPCALPRLLDGPTFGSSLGVARARTRWRPALPVHHYRPNLGQPPTSILPHGLFPSLSEGECACTNCAIVSSCHSSGTMLQSSALALPRCCSYRFWLPIVERTPGTRLAGSDTSRRRKQRPAVYRAMYPNKSAHPDTRLCTSDTGNTSGPP